MDDLTPDLDGTRSPGPLYEALNAKYKFVIDLFAAEDNAKLALHFSKSNDAFSQDWPRLATAGWCWSNPPYSRGFLGRYVEKVIAEVRKGSAVVGLIPATPGTQWFNDSILRCCDVLEGYTVDEGPVSGYCLSMSGNGYRQKVTWLRGRVPFESPIGWPVERDWNPPATDSILWEVRPPLR